MHSEFDLPVAMKIATLGEELIFLKKNSKSSTHSGVQ
jgi:hypothetical protein